MSFKLKGVGNMKRKLDAVLLNFGFGVRRAGTREADAILIDAQDNYVPVDSEDLRNSGQVSEIRKVGGGYRIDISFGDAQTEAYAAAVHEHLSEHSPPSWQPPTEVQFSPSGRGPKYLEKPLLKAVAGMDKRIAQVITTEIK